MAQINDRWHRGLSWTMHWALMLALLVGAFSAPVQAQNFPDKPSNQVLDQVSALSANDAQAIARLVEQARAAGEDLAVAIINSCEGAAPRAHATALFNHWALGEQLSNRGVLIFIAVEDRRAEIILGSGIDSPDMQAQAEQIMQNAMVPKFRRADFGGGAFAGALAVSEQIFNLLIATETEAGAEFTSATSEVEALAQAREALSAAAAPESGSLSKQITGYLVLGLTVLALPFAGMAWLTRRWYRRHIARRCNRCKSKMGRLSEAADDAYLDAKARTEERINSVSHDVWLCEHCHQVEHVAYEAWFSNYGKCPSCKTKAFGSRSEVREAASTHADGWGMIFGDCQSCSHHSTHRYTIRREAERSSSGSAIGSYSSSSSSSSSSGSSGGSSRGGGASGSW